MLQASLYLIYRFGSMLVATQPRLSVHTLSFYTQILNNQHKPCDYLEWRTKSGCPNTLTFFWHLNTQVCVPPEHTSLCSCDNSTVFAILYRCSSPLPGKKQYVAPSMSGERAPAAEIHPEHLIFVLPFEPEIPPTLEVVNKGCITASLQLFWQTFPFSFLHSKVGKKLALKYKSKSKLTALGKKDATINKAVQDEGL